MLTLHLEGSFAAFAFRIDTNFSSIFLGDGGDGKCVTTATVLNLILEAGSDGYSLVEPRHIGICWCDSALEYGIFPLHCGYIVQFGGESHLSGC